VYILKKKKVSEEKNSENNDVDGFSSYSELSLLEQKSLVDLENIIGMSIPEIYFEDLNQQSNGFIVHKGHIVFLRLRNTKILRLPMIIGNLKKLRYLDLAGNSIKNFPVSIKNLKNLKVLNLSGNNFLDNIIKITNYFPKLNLVWFFDSRIKIEANVKEIQIPENRSSITTQNQKSNENNQFSNNKDFFIQVRDILRKSKTNGGLNENEKENKERNPELCESCNNQKMETLFILLDNVRKSPRKLVFEIRLVVAKCTNCHQKRSFSNIGSFKLENLLNLKEILKEEIKFYLNQNYYCSACSKYYKNLKKCPVHNIEMKIPLLVFIRGINQQYTSSYILKTT